jgi:hypothetical protein
MSFARNTLMIVVLTMLAAAAGQAKITVDYDDSADFSGYKTFAWRKGTPVANELAEKRIRAAVERELEAKGFAKVEGAADFYVVTHASVEGQKQIDVYSLGYGGYEWRGWQRWRGYPRYGRSTVNVREIEVGTLLVDLLDGESEELVWRALGTGTVPQKPEKAEKRINKVTAKMFRHLPGR